jgi:hypothetical protein
MNKSKRTKKSYTSFEKEILKNIKSKKARQLIDIENRKKISKFLKATEDGVKHFSVPLTDKYEAYSCFALPNSLNLGSKYIAGLVVKVKNKEDTVDAFLFRLFTFDRKNLDENLLLKDGYCLELLNKLLEENLIYFTSEKFTDKRIELGIKKFITNEIEGNFN